MSSITGLDLLSIGTGSLVENIVKNKRVWTWEPTFFGGLLVLASCYVLLRSSKTVIRIIAFVYLIILFAFILLIITLVPMTGAPPMLQYCHILFVLIEEILLIWLLVKEFLKLSKARV